MNARLAGWATVAALIPFAASAERTAPSPPFVQLVFTSDCHYGIIRSSFRGRSSVDAQTVNRALVAGINRLATATLPQDGGLRSTESVGAIDFVVEGGDISNREEVTATEMIQPAAISWAEFAEDYIAGLTLRDSEGQPTPLYLIPGNHDVSNAIGYYKPMRPPKDAVPMLEIFNRMMRPEAPRTQATYVYPRDAVEYTRDFGGVHFIFITIWPDSAARAWLDRDLARVSTDTPVILFSHDGPAAEAKHFRNPNGTHDINDTDRFENLLGDDYADDQTTTSTDVEQRALEAWVGRHPNLSAYFHGNNNWNQFYDWTGPGHHAALHTFRVDSPMKGHISGRDERQLSFQVATIDPVSRTMTVRECLWNHDPHDPGASLAWGASTTVALSPRPR